MVQADPEKLAAALRENLRKRKAQGRGPGRAPQPTFGADEEGDFPPEQDAQKVPDKGSSQ